jgi:hypothetical protein
MSRDLVYHLLAVLPSNKHNPRKAGKQTKPPRIRAKKVKLHANPHPLRFGLI